MRASYYNPGVARDDTDDLYPYSVQRTVSDNWLLTSLITGAVIGNFAEYGEAELAAKAQLARVAGICENCD